LLEGAALDKYQFVRDAYLQRRRNQIYDGNPPHQKDVDEGDDSPEPAPPPKDGDKPDPGTEKPVPPPDQPAPNPAR
jgi:phospholipid-binding lipoprotein MlaA